MTETELADRLASMISDLDGHIERRAAELAAPAIEDAERSCKWSELRVTDLQQEFGRQIAALEKRVARWRELAEGKATDMILRWDEVQVGDRIIEEGGNQFRAVTRIDEDDDGCRWGILVLDEDGRAWSTSALPDNLVAVRRSKEQAGG